MQRLTAICYLLPLVLAETQILLSVNFTSKFPHFIENAFTMEIQSRSENGKLSSDPSDTMVIRIVDLNYTEIERAYLIYGVQDFIDDEFKGKLMDIKVWEKTPSGTAMNISIMFKRGAHKKYLEIFYFSALDKLQRRRYLKNLSLSKRLFHELIDLFIPSTLVLSVIPIRVDRREIIINDFVMASCRAFDGIPRYKPRFDNHVNINVTETKYNKTTNEIRMTFRASLSDHLTNFSCSAGNVTETLTIRVWHYPSEILIRPDINKILQGNRTIQCYALHGYPPPKIRFHLIEGPSNASQYYEIRGNGSQIYINLNAPIGSLWKWKCSMISTIANAALTKETEVTFNIAGHPTSIRIKPIPDRIMEPDSTIDCAPSDGYPVAAAKWEVIDGPENASLYYNIMRNGTQIHLKENCPTKSQWKIKCIVQSCIENTCEILNKIINFRTANHPTALYIHPIINKRFRSNSAIKCYTSDGYPDPEINWQLIEGPPNAERFYNITEKGHQININNNSPTGSKWTFNCIMKSSLVNTKKILNKSISFAVAKNPMKICGEKCLNSRISAIEESVEENGKLHEDLKLVLNITDQMKEQISSLAKALRKEQKEEFQKWTSPLERMLNSMRTEFQYIFIGANQNIKTSKQFISMQSLTVEFWLRILNKYMYGYDNYNRYLECGLNLASEVPITFDLKFKYECHISKLSVNSHVSVQFNILFKGRKYMTKPVEVYTNNMLDSAYDAHNILVKCYLLN